MSSPPGYSEYNQVQYQVGGLPVRKTNNGYELLFISSQRDSSQWVVPKGFKKKRENDYEALSRKALEEAGIKGIVKEKLGNFDDVEKNARICAYYFEIVEVLAHWEQENRKRKWMSIDEALKLVTRPAILNMVTAFKLHYDTPVVAPVVKAQPEEKKINNEETGICVICMDKKK